MVVVRMRPALLLSVVFVCSMLAGCLGDDAPAPAGDDPVPSASATPSSSVSAKPKDTPLVKVDSDSAIFAPTWKQGMTWTYAVSGSLLPESYETTIGVVSVESDHYSMGADSIDELQNYAHFAGGVLLGGIQKDSLAVAHGDSYQDIFGFRRPAGDEWTVTLFGAGFTLTKPEPAEVTHALGTDRGLTLTGPASKGGNATIVYATDVGGLALFQWLDDEGNTVLEYKLTGHAPSGGASGLKQWTVLGKDHGDASGPPNNGGAEQWDSDGAGSFVFIRAVLTPTDAAGAVVVDPSGDVAVQVIAEGTDGPTRWDGNVPDEAGTWTMVLFHDSGINPNTNGGRSDVFLYQIEETVY